MIERIRPLNDVRQTASEMYRLARTYATDLAQWSRWGFLDVFGMVRAIPYHEDPVGMEFVRRPMMTLMGLGRGGPDCDDKAVVMGAWASLMDIPFRFVAAARRAGKPLHHVWCEYFLAGRWLVMDATYPWSEPYENGSWARREVMAA